MTINERRCKRKFDPKKNKKTKYTKPKEREIYYASHYDSHVYAWYADILKTKYEAFIRDKAFEPAVLAYRSLAKTNIHFARDAFDKIKALAPCHVLAMDLEKFFDSLDHGLLKTQWAKVLLSPRLPTDHFAVYRAITSFSYCEAKEITKVCKEVRRKHRWHLTTPAEFRSLIASTIKLPKVEDRLIKLHVHDSPYGIANKGIPQGSPISSVLANIYMLDFDAAAYDLARKCGGAYFRYSDDILFVLPVEDPAKIESQLQVLMQEAKVSVQPEKTDRLHFTVNERGKLNQLTAKSLQYLGFTFDGRRIMIRDSSLAKYFKKIHKYRRIVQWLHGRKKFGPKAGHGKFLSRYTNRGKRNFVQYALRSARLMDSKSIKKQVRKSLKITQSVFRH
jgi:hypothetical protein